VVGGPSKPIGSNLVDNLSPFCVNKKCTMRLACEHAQERKGEGMRDVVDYLVGKPTDCENFVQRRELNPQGEVPRIGRRRRHNAHAPERPNRFADPKNVDLRKFGMGIVDLTQPGALGPKIGDPGNLPEPPDLQVARHIRKGKNIKKDGDN